MFDVICVPSWATKIIQLQLLQLKLHLFLLPFEHLNERVFGFTTLGRNNTQHMENLKHKETWKLFFPPLLLFGKSHAICFYNLTREKSLNFPNKKKWSLDFFFSGNRDDLFLLQLATASIWNFYLSLSL